MNHRLQTRYFRCTGCGASLLHDRMHGHWAFECPARQPRPTTPKWPVFVGKSYEPKQS